MSERSNSQTARVIAILALIGAFIVVVAVIATSIGDSSSGSQETAITVPEGPTEPTTPAGEKAVARGFYVVKRGDTLIVISAATGVPQETLLELNPQLDPQALIPGQKIRLD